MWRYALNGTIACTAGFVPNFSQKLCRASKVCSSTGLVPSIKRRSVLSKYRLPHICAFLIYSHRYTLQICTKPTCSKACIFGVSAIEATTDASAERPAQAELDLSAWRGERPCLAYLLGLWRKVFGHP